MKNSMKNEDINERRISYALDDARLIINNPKVSPLFQEIREYLELPINGIETEKLEQWKEKYLYYAHNSSRATFLENKIKEIITVSKVGKEWRDFIMHYSLTNTFNEKLLPSQAVLLLKQDEAGNQKFYLEVEPTDNNRRVALKFSAFKKQMKELSGTNNKNLYPKNKYIIERNYRIYQMVTSGSYASHTEVAEELSNELGTSITYHDVARVMSRYNRSL